MLIESVVARDMRFQLEPGVGSDAVHSAPQYSFAVSVVTLESGLQGTGLALTIGAGNDLVCRAIEMLAAPLTGTDIEELMADFGRFFPDPRR